MEAPGIRLQLASVAQLHIAHGGPRELAPPDAALFAWLATEGPTPRARVVQLLWPDKDGGAARNLLRQRLFRHRKLWGVDLVVGGSTLQLADGVTHDLASADGMLGDSPSPAEGELARWLALQRERRLARVRQALAQLCDTAERACDIGSALQHARELLALEPLSEEAHRRVMRLHYLQGNRAAALLAFDACKQMLKNEVGATPDAQTLSLLRQIETSSLPALVAAEGALPVAVLRPPRLVGRELEWQQLQQAWAGDRVVWLRGEGGMGKSRLLADFAQARRLDGAPMLVVGARPGDAALPHALLCRLLRQVLAAHPAELSAGVRAELARLLPELGPSPATHNAAQLPFAVETLLNAAARHGLQAIAIDDLHWADRASVDALQQVCTASPLQWMLALRPAEADRAVQALRDLMSNAHRLAFVDLEPLTLDAVAALLDSLGLAGLQSAQSAAVLHRRCGGNPLLLLECLKAGWHQGRFDASTAPAAERLIEQRLLRLSPPALRLARCAAVAGQDFDAALAAAVLRATPLELADAWAELESAQVLRDRQFAHDLVLEATLASVPAAIARELHAEMAAWLQARGSEAARIASHWMRGDRPVQALPHLRLAAHVAAAQGGNLEAAAWYAQASRIAEDHGDTHAALLDHIRSVEVRSRFDVIVQGDVDRAKALARDERDDAYVLMMRAEWALFDGRSPDTLALASAAAELARRFGLTEIEAECEWMGCVANWDAREGGTAIQHCERSLALWRSLDPQLCCLDARNRLRMLEHAQALLLTGLGRFTEAQRGIEATLESLARDNARLDMVAPTRNLTLGALELGQAEQAAQWARRLELLTHDMACPPHDASLNEAALALWCACAGRWGEAWQRFEAVDDVLARHGHRQAGFFAFASAGFECELGRRDLALRRLRSLQASGSLLEVQALAVEVALVAAGDPRDAGHLLERVAMLHDMSWRLRLLIRLAPRCEAAGVLPVLALAAGAAREGGAMGYWVVLQALRGAALLRAGRSGEAADLAAQAWAAVERGARPAALFPAFAATVVRACQAARPDLSGTVAHRGWQALMDATRHLPDGFRSACLERSEMALELRMLGAHALPPSP